MDNKFWEFINSHWLFINKEKYIDNMTALTYEITKRNECNREGMYLDLFGLFEDYVKFVSKN
jgi:hypothetical protein